MCLARRAFFFAERRTVEKKNQKKHFLYNDPLKKFGISSFNKNKKTEFFQRTVQKLLGTISDYT